jgi:hypothetical protein
MVEAALILDAVIIALLSLIIARSFWKSEEVHDRLDDVIEGVGLFANEVLSRTDELREMGSAMAPAIELHNHNPLEQIFTFISQMRSGNFSTDNITKRREPDGRYATTERLEEIQHDPTPEIIDLVD